MKARVVVLGLSVALTSSGLDLWPAENSTGQRLTATPELVGQKYCSGDNDIFSVVLDLRVKFVNRGDTPIILDRGIGKAWYQLAVAKNKESLLAKNFESHPNLDWIGSVQVPSTGSPERLLRSEFVVIAPGANSEAEVKPFVFVWYQNVNDPKGMIIAGRHVIEVYLSAWNHAGNPSKFKDAWRQYGELADGVITTEPVEFEVPKNPMVEANWRQIAANSRRSRSGDMFRSRGC